MDETPDTEMQGTDTETETPKTFSQDDLNRIMSKEREKFSRQQKELEARYQRELKKAGLDAEERAKADREDELKAYKDRADAAEREVRRAHAEKALTRAGLSEELADAVMGEDDDATERNIKALSKAVKAAADAQYNARIAKGSPQAPAQSVEGRLTTEDKNQLRAQAGLPPLKP